jgi:hypothetical protein
VFADELPQPRALPRRSELLVGEEMDEGGDQRSEQGQGREEEKGRFGSSNPVATVTTMPANPRMNRIGNAARTACSMAAARPGMD